MATKNLSLVEHGSFFEDPFFKDALEDFDKAMEGVLDKYETKGTKVSSSNRVASTETYRNIRNANIGKDLYASQALSITEKDGKFNCVMDVKDFNPKDLSVRVVDDRVVVEGKYMQQSEDGSSVAAKEFYKEFNMPPSADIDQVGTALSKDGILTVKAPKREGDAPNPGGPVTQSSASKESSMAQSQSVSDDGTKSSKSMKSSSSSFSSSSSSSTMGGAGGMPGMTMGGNMGGMMNMDDMAKDMKDRLGAGSLMSSEFGDMKGFGSSSLGSSSINSSSSLSSSKVTQMSSKSSFSSSSSSTMSSGMNMMGGGDDMLGDMSKDMQDRLIFSHETANIKLPAEKK